MAKRNIVFFVLAIAIIIAAGLFLILQFTGKEKPVAENKLYKIGILQTSAALDAAYLGFKEKMKELGYEEGNNIYYDYFDTKGDIVAGKEEAARFVSEQYDLIYAIGNDPAKEAQEVTQGSEIPVVFAIVSDPVKAGLVKSLQTSGTNIAGVTPANHEASAKRVELLKEIKPDLKRIILPYNDSVTLGLDNVKKAARDLGIELVEKYVANPQELDAFLASFKFESTDAILRATDSISAARVTALIETAKKNRVPLAGTSQADVKSGALLSYGANYSLLGKQAAAISDQILRGKAKPTNLPVQFPEKFELSVNKKTAEMIGIRLTQEFLAKADQIIEK